MSGRFSPEFFIKSTSKVNSTISWIKEVKDISLDLFMIFGPSLNYVFQVIKFHRTKSSKGFSNFLCLVTILAHTTKIYFWFGERYKFTLLIQSILVIFILLYVIYLCIKFQEIPEGEATLSLLGKRDITLKEKIKNFICDYLSFKKTFNPKLIWRWDNVFEYYKFYCIILAVLTGFLFLLGIKNKYYSIFLGYINLGLELLCSLPQIIELYRTKDQRNISKLMILCWFTGNIVKIYYNYYNNSPLQLILGSYIQVFFNIILIVQIVYYYNKNKLEIKNDKDKEEKTEQIKDLKLIENTIEEEVEEKERLI